MNLGVLRRPTSSFFGIDVIQWAREDWLVVDRVFALHTEPMPWTEVTSALEEVRRSAPGGGG